jgi:hypothetical protein
MDIGEKNQLNIAKKSMDYNCIGTVFLGLSHTKAIEVIKQATGEAVAPPTDCSCQYLHGHLGSLHG